MIRKQFGNRASSTKKIAGVVLLLSLVALAGCGLLGGASISNTHVQIGDGEVSTLAFNYSVSDYSTAFLEGPDGELLSEKRLNPDKNSEDIRFGSLEPGEYELTIQNGGDTVAQKTLVFEGSEPVVQNVSAKWSANSLEVVRVTIRNKGDLPLSISRGSITVRDSQIEEDGIFQLIAPNNKETLEFKPSYAETIKIQNDGVAKGEVVLRTSNGTLSGSFENEFEGAELVMTRADPHWDGNTLTSVDVTVQNEGDLPTRVNGSVERGGEKLGWSSDKQLPTGDSVDLEISSGWNELYQASSGGNTSFRLVVDSPDGHITKAFTHYVEPANLSLVSVSPNWQGSNLESVDFTARNGGEVDQDFTAVLSINGEEIQEWEQSIEASSTDNYVFESTWGYEPVYTAASGGEYSVTVTVVGNSGEKSKTKIKRFDGVSGTISNVSPIFIGNYDSGTSDLSSLDFRVQNRGDVALVYDSVRISIDGVSRTSEFYSTKTLQPGESEREYLSLLDGLTVSNGAHEMQITLLNGGKTVLTETVSTSTDN